MNHQQNRERRSSDPAKPNAGCEIGIGRDEPEHDGNGDQGINTGPLYRATHPRGAMRVAITDAANPMSPEPDRQNRNPEDMAYIEGANGDGSARSLAGHAVVVAKCHPLRTEMVGAVNQEHGDWSSFVEERAAVY